MSGKGKELKLGRWVFLPRDSGCGWREEALLLGLVFDFSAPGFLPATQDAGGGVFGIGYFFQYFFSKC